MWVSKQAPDFLNPAFKSVSTWTSIFVTGVFVKFGWLKQRGKTLGANWSPPTSHGSTSGSINVSNVFVFSSSHSHLFLLVRSYGNKSRMLVSSMHDGQLRLCGGLRVYGMTPLPVVSVLPGCSSPLGANTCWASSLLLFDTAACVLPPSHVLTRARDKHADWAGEPTVHQNVMVCVFLCVCVVLNAFVWSP